MATVGPFAAVRLDAKVNSLVYLEIGNLFECLAAAVNVACEKGVSDIHMILDHVSKRGNLTQLTAIMATGELTFPVVEVHVIVQRIVG